MALTIYRLIAWSGFRSGSSPIPDRAYAGRWSTASSKKENASSLCVAATATKCERLSAWKGPCWMSRRYASLISAVV